jgi:hypothetical protein
MSTSEELPSSTARTWRNGLRIDAIASGFVAALALAVSTYNVYLQREQLRAQMWPHLQWMYSNSSSVFQLEAMNAGVGPAIIEGVRVTVDGKQAETWKAAFDMAARADPALGALLGNPEFAFGTSSLSRRVLGAGVTVNPVQSPIKTEEARQLFPRVFEKVQVEICYCSTLHECWIAPDTRSVSSCPSGFDFKQ